MSGTIIRGTYVMTPQGLKKDYGLRMEEGRITQVAQNGELKKKPGDQVVEAYGQMILPGFVNGHNHMYGFLSHGITAKAKVTEFESFLEHFWWPCVEDKLNHELAQVTARWACVEMIESGITAFVDILEGPNSIPGALEAERRVIEEAGLRGRISFEACERVSKENGQLGLKENIDFVKNHNKEGELVQGLNSIHTLFTCSREFIKEAKILSHDNGCMTHMHLSESVYESDWCAKNYKKTPVEVYQELGYLDENVLASQVVQVSDNELDILAKYKVKVVSMPLSNCEVGGGFAPVTKMLERGMTVGLGTDGYVNNFFEVMRGAFLVHKANQKNPMVMPARTVYEMATSMGARAAGIGDAGELKEGKLADVITVSLDTPTPINEKNVYDQLVLFRNPDKVQNVYVNGKCLKKDGHILTIDKEKARKALQSMTRKFWDIQAD